MSDTITADAVFVEDPTAKTRVGETWVHIKNGVVVAQGIIGVDVPPTPVQGVMYD